jgi:hypothetical protein
MTISVMTKSVMTLTGGVSEEGEVPAGIIEAKVAAVQRGMTTSVMA